jgi:hypothetical protein
VSYVLQTSAHLVRPFGAYVRHRKRRSRHVSCSVTYEMSFYLEYDFGKIQIFCSVSFYFPIADWSVKLATVCVEGQTVCVLFYLTVFLSHSRNASRFSESELPLTHHPARLRASSSVAV